MSMTAGLMKSLPLALAKRRRIEEFTFDLIEVVDQNDGDPDLEPSLRWSRYRAFCLRGLWKRSFSCRISEE